MRCPILLLTAALLSAVVPAVEGQDQGGMNAGPNRTEGTATIGRGHVQLAVGAAWSRDRDHLAGTEGWSRSLGAGSLVFGLLPTLDGELQWAAHERTLSRSFDPSVPEWTEERARGGSDLGLRLRWQLLAGPVGLALLPCASVPCGGREVGGDLWQGGAILACEGELAEDWTWGLMGEVDLVRDELRKATRTYIGSAALYWSPIESLTLDLETWVEVDEKLERDHRWVGSAGAAWNLNDHLQVNLNCCCGLNRLATDLNLAAGLALWF